LPAGGLEGIISDASTGAPVEGAQVTVAGQVGVLTVATDSAGKYEVTDLTAGAYLVSVQATGYYANAEQVGVVAGVISSGNVALEPAEVAIAAVAPTATPTLMPTMPPTATPVPTPTVPPTPTPAQPASTGSRSTTTRAAPVLAEPRDGAIFEGPARITFRWTGSCCLAADEYYVVSIPHAQGVEEGWVKTTEWEAPDYLYLLVPRSRRLAWSVSVRRHTGEHPNKQWKGPIVSGISETWHIVWRYGGGPTSPLAPPVSPLATPWP
jgi:hypothetical protein